MTSEQAADELSAETQQHEEWERGRRHGIRQARRPQMARVRELEQEIEDLLTLQEANHRAFANRCARVRELEARLADAVEFDITAGDERLTVYAHGDSWVVRRGDGTHEDHPSQEAALARADQIAATHEGPTTGGSIPYDHEE